MNDIWPREEGDFMEFGNSGWIPIKGGAFYNKITEEYKSPDGKVFSSLNEMERYTNAADQ